MSIRLAIEHRTVYVVHPGGRSYARTRANAEARRASRFTSSGHTPGTIQLDDPRRDGGYPRTLDLRRARRR